MKEYTKKFLEIIKNKYKKNPEQYEKLPISMKMNDFKELPYFETSYAVNLSDVIEELKNTDLFYNIKPEMGDNLEFYLSDKGKDFFNNKIEIEKEKTSPKEITVNNIYGGNNQIGDNNNMVINDNNQALEMVDKCIEIIKKEQENSEKLEKEFEKIKETIEKSNKKGFITTFGEICTIGSAMIEISPFIYNALSSLFMYMK